LGCIAWFGCLSLPWLRCVFRSGAYDGQFLCVFFDDVVVVSLKFSWYDTILDLTHDAALFLASPSLSTTP
jgi:hypothetical protein